VFQYMCEEFPDADVYALACNPATTYPYFSTRKINTTWLNPFVRTMEAFRWSFPLATYTMQALDLSGYDLVISSSATVAKYVRVPNGKHVCYCYIPTRALWNYQEYFGASIKTLLVKPWLSHLRRHDFEAAQRVDKFIAISEVSRQAIAQSYERESEIIHSPIDLKMFSPGKKDDHYLIVSRLEKWKRVDYAVEAFNSLGLPLRIVGTGAEESALRSISRPNITFVGEVDDATLAQEYRRAKAVVFTPHLEYGLIPLEANASGTPVICFGKGGVEETLIQVPNSASTDARNATAVFFYEQSAASLVEAVNRFQSLSFDTTALVRHAALWDVPAFKRRLRIAVLAALAPLQPESETRAKEEQVIVSR
jgi:glycosyltransferase involved in cell wall biosynthesis